MSPNVGEGTSGSPGLPSSLGFKTDRGERVNEGSQVNLKTCFSLRLLMFQKSGAQGSVAGVAIGHSGHIGLPSSFGFKSDLATHIISRTSSSSWALMAFIASTASPSILNDNLTIYKQSGASDARKKLAMISKRARR